MLMFGKENMLELDYIAVQKSRFLKKFKGQAPNDPICMYAYLRLHKWEAGRAMASRSHHNI